MAQGDGLHVKEADVHLGLDVDALPDLKHGRSGVSGHPRSPRPPATPRPPTSTAHRDAPTGEIQSEAWNLFHLPLLVNWADIRILLDCHSKLLFKC